MTWTNIFTGKRLVILVVLILLAHASILYFMGQIPICECGYIKFWHGVNYSSENSQHISDWYSFSHIIHGFIFYFLLWLVSRRFKISFGVMLISAILVEVGWEIFENTDFIINRYREVTISLDYFGDSILNSVSDVMYMILGFVLARKQPVWLSLLMVIGMEIFVGYYIRDNLTLNVVMLVYPLDFIREWQMGG